MKILRSLVTVILFFIALTPLSLYITYKKINYYGLCQEKTKNQINPQCDSWKYVDTFLSVPIVMIQNITTIKFAWGEEKETGVVTCHNIYQGLKIGTIPIFVAKTECIPI